MDKQIFQVWSSDRQQKKTFFATPTIENVVEKGSENNNKFNLNIFVYTTFLF